MARASMSYARATRLARASFKRTGGLRLDAQHVSSTVKRGEAEWEACGRAVDSALKEKPREGFDFALRRETGFLDQCLACKLAACGRVT